MPAVDHDPVRLPIRLTTDPTGAIVGVERSLPSTPRAPHRAGDAPFKCWRSDVFLNDERLQACETIEILAPADRIGPLFNALCDTARRHAPAAEFVEFRSWQDYHDAVRSHRTLQGALS
jgi:hypothetical protein